MTLACEAKHVVLAAWQRQKSIEHACCKDNSLQHSRADAECNLNDLGDITFQKEHHMMLSRAHCSGKNSESGPVMRVQ